MHGVTRVHGPHLGPSVRRRRPLRPAFWRLAFPVWHLAAATARDLEDQGWDGVAFTDSQNIAADPYVAMALAAQATTTLGVSTGVTNLVTRHPAVVASAMATIQDISGGRAVVGVGRGDSSLAHLGRGPQPINDFAADLNLLQAYLHGKSRELLGHSPILWAIRAGIPKVPVDVAATGEKMIRLGAAKAEGVTLALGADAHRIRAALAKAADAYSEQDRSWPLSIGAYVNISVDRDLAAARARVRGGLSARMRFSAMGRFPAPDLGKRAAEVIARVHSSYDLRRHGKTAAEHSMLLDDDFVERFAIVGSSDRCVDRLGALMELGIDRFLFLVASVDEPAADLDSSEIIASEIIPQLRSYRPTSAA